MEKRKLEIMGRKIYTRDFINPLFNVPDGTEEYYLLQDKVAIYITYNNTWSFDGNSGLDDILPIKFLLEFEKSYMNPDNEFIKILENEIEKIECDGI